MLRTAFRLLAVAALVLPALGHAQEVAGRLLIAVGDVAIQRGTARIVATSGTEVRAGDTLQLGPQANAQLRLTDESMISLRPDTVFRLTEYAYQGRNPDQQRAFFDLVRGGVRTVTGIVGRLNQANYAVVTPTSTIGIRGTHYTLAHRDSFQLPDGSRAPGGTFGAVTDGRISVTNQAGVSVFGSDQYFRVDSPTAAPVQLLAPPSQLTQEGRISRTAAAAKPAAGAQAQGSSTSSTASSGSESSTTVAQTGLGGGTGDTGIAAAVSNPAPIVIPETTSLNTFVANEAITSGGIAPTIQAGLTGTSFYRVAGAVSIPVTCSNPPCGTITSAEITLGVNFTLQQAGIRASFRTAAGEVFNLGTPFNAQIPIVVSGGQATINSSIKLSDFPTQTGAFRCSACGAGGTVGFMTEIGVSGTISGGSASVTLKGSDAAGTASFNVTLTQQTPPNNLAAAAVTPTSGGGASARSDAFWSVGVNASQALTSIGPSIGGPAASIASATQTIKGSAPTAGNLVWGTWGGSGATVTDFNYVTFTTSGNQQVPWITGTATNTLPASLGSSVTYTPIGSLVNAGTGTLNSGSLTANFVNQTMSISLNATNPGANNTFQMNGSSGFSQINGRFSAGFSTVTCTGSCSGPGSPNGNFGGFFAGANAEGAGVAFTAGFGAGTGVSGVAAFKR